MQYTEVQNIAKKTIEFIKENTQQAEGLLQKMTLKLSHRKYIS